VEKGYRPVRHATDRILKYYVAYTISAEFLPRDVMLAWCMLSSCVRLPACPSVCHPYCIEKTGRIELVLAWRLPFTYPILCCKEIWVFLKIRAIPSATLSQTPDLENFVTASRRRRSSLLTTLYDNRRVVAVYYNSINCNASNSVTAICC